MTHPDPELLHIFAAEQAEHVGRMRSVVDGLHGPQTDSAVFEELLRRAHTLKGAARAAGFEPTETLTHMLESVFANLRRGELPVSLPLRSLCSRSLDTIEDILASVLSQRAVPEIEGLLHEIAETLGTKAEIASSSLQTAPEPPAAVSPAEFVRINAAYLDELMGASSELVASAAGAAPDAEAGVPEEVARAQAILREWSRLRQRAAPYIRKRHRDPEFSSVLECIEGAERQLHWLTSEVQSEAAARQRREWDLRRLTDRLDETAIRVRMVSADTVFGGFGPMVRNLAQEYPKQIEFRVEGLDLPADRVVLQSLKDPVMHLLRNALSHGIEMENERIAQGKPPAGTIRLRTRSQAGLLQVTVEDDGRGLNRTALIDEAIRQGLLADAPSAPSEQDLTDLMFLPGFSTSSVLTTLSGRGLGLAIVRDEVNRLRGEISVHSEPGKGTAITISVPLSVSSQHVLLVAASGHTFGIPVSSIQQVCRFKSSEIQTFEGRPAIVIDSLPVGLLRLSDLLDLPASVSDTQTEPILQIVVVAASGRKGALAVDRLVDVRDAVIKPLGLPSSSAGWSTGGIPLPDGTVAVILNVAQLLGRFREASIAHAGTFTAAKPQERAQKILVVDDSLTTRSLEKSLLEAHGYEVLVAIDGVDALEKLRAGIVDLVITDIVMPRMDGFQLLEQIRRDKTLAGMPVIVVSSMEGREDQERGLALGADAYIAKRKFDQRELLETIRQIL